MARRVLLLVSALLLLTPAFAADSASAASAPVSFFGTSVSQGNSLLSLDMGNNLRMTGVTITSVTASSANASTIAATGSLHVGSDRTPLAVTLSYTNVTKTVTTAVGPLRATTTTLTGTWSINLSRGSAGTGYSPTSGSVVNLNNLSGTLSGTVTDGNVTRGTLTAALRITGVTYAGATLDGTASVTSSGLEASVALGDITPPRGASVGSLMAVASSTSATTQLAVQLGGVSVNVAGTYTNSSNWSVTMAPSASAGPASMAGSLDMSQVSGSIAVTKGVASVSLSASVTVGDTTFNPVALQVSAGGLAGTVTIASPLTIAEGYVIESGTVTASTSSASASITNATFAAAGTTVAASASWTDATDWSLSLAANTAGSGQAAPQATSTTLDVNAISGTINDVDGHLNSALMASGVALGDGTFDMVATFNSADGSFSASASGEDLTLGGMVLDSAAISMSTASQEAQVSADFTTEAGTFSFQIGASAISTGGYTLHIAATAADLAVSSSSSRFSLQSFGFDTTVTAPTTGCTTVDAAVNGSLKMRGYLYALNNAEIAFSCNTLTKFVFSISVTHQTSTTTQKSLTLTINWFSDHGSYTPTFGTASGYTSKAPYSGTTVKYYSGFFGTVDLSYLYYFQRSDFNKHVTFGLGFSVAVYQQQVKTVSAQSAVGGSTTCTPISPCYSAGAWDVQIGAMGYFDADERVNGDIECNLNVAPSNDVVCHGSMYVNPASAGTWTEHMDNI